MLRFIFIFLLSISSFSQGSLNDVLNKFNKETVPYIYVDDLKKDIDNVLLLDSREFKEYTVSHLNKAIYVGYKNFNLSKTLEKLPREKSSKIVVYCSLGVRSENIAEKIKKAGYTNVYNLYGGIFEWKNDNNKVVNPQNKSTEKVHAYDKDWGKWLTKGIKIYD